MATVPDRKDLLRAAYPYYLAGEAVDANEDLEVVDKYTQEVATRRKEFAFGAGAASGAFCIWPTTILLRPSARAEDARRSRQKSAGRNRILSKKMGPCRRQKQPFLEIATSA